MINSRAYLTPHVGVLVETQWLQIASTENCHPSSPRLLTQEDPACKIGGFTKNTKKGGNNESLETARSQRAQFLEENRETELV
jgi:hypothetical protein